MRRSLMILAASFFLSVSGICYGAYHVSAPREDIVFTETALYGDNSWAEGLTVESKTHYESHAVWDSTVRFDGGGYESGTTYTYYQRAYTGNSNGSDFWLEFREDTGVWFVEGETEGAARALQELLEETEPGFQAEKTVRLADYCDYYPIAMMIVFPGHIYRGYPGMDDRESYPGVAVYRKFQQFFRIPVLEDEYLELTVQVSADGNGYSSIGQGSSDYGDWYELYSEGLFVEDTFYFYLSSARSRNGEAVDFSLVPGGFGLYRLPYLPGEREELNDVDLDAMSMVYPLDESARVVHLSASADGRKLLLHTIEEGTYYVTVIDRESMGPLQKLPLFPFDTENDWLAILDGEDFTLVSLRNERLLLLGQEDGAYGVRLDVPAVREGMEKNAVSLFFGSGIYPGKGNLDWDGERLVLVWTPWEDAPEKGGYWGYFRCGFQLAVYDHQGIRFIGDYWSSLGDDNFGESYRDYCRPWPENPLRARWTRE